MLSESAQNNLNVFLAKQFGIHYDPHKDAIALEKYALAIGKDPNAVSLEIQHLISNCKPVPLTGCWYSGDIQLHQEAMEWHLGTTKKRLFSFGLGESLGKIVVRHSPTRCEVMSEINAYTASLRHINCCRPSHLCWGDIPRNNQDKCLRMKIENDDEYINAAQVFLSTVDTVAARLSQTIINDEVKCDVTVAPAPAPDPAPAPAPATVPAPAAASNL